MSELTIKEIRKKFREETGKDATIRVIRETTYRSGYPKKQTVENYNPVYTKWLEDLIVKSSI